MKSGVPSFLIMPGHRHYHHSSSGFTIVELLVVIVVIGILAAVTVVAYSGLSQRARDVTLRSDLINSAKQMQLDYITNGTMSSIFPNGVKVSPGVGLSLSSTGNTNSFCINGQITGSGQTSYLYYDSVSSTLQSGWCSGDTVLGSELGVSQNFVTNNSFSNISGSGWWLNVSASGGVTLTTRAGTSSDPIPNKPVLILTNTTSKTETWAVLQGPIAYGSLKNGLSYKSDIWVRATGTFTGIVSAFGIKDGNGLNATLPTGSNVSPTASWQKSTVSSAATRDGTSGNLLYLPINNGVFTSTGWTLEFQDPQLTQL